ncbi:MAG: hypothetical protein AB1427_20965 [Thermodesulfobacteriota bacterium]
MTEGENRNTRRTAGSGSVKPDSSGNGSAIESRVEDLFRKFEAKPEEAPGHRPAIDDLEDIHIEIEEKGVHKPGPEKGIQKPDAGLEVRKPKPEKKRPGRLRLVYGTVAVLMATAAVVAFITLKPKSRPVPEIPAVPETLHKIVLPAPKASPSASSRAKEPAQPVPQADSHSEAIKAFLMKWKTAWENTAGRGGDLETFMSFYSDSFTSKGLSKNEWRSDKAQKNRLKDWIRLEIKNIQIIEPASEQRTEVRFLLAYSSSNYADETFQTLILKKEAEHWKIVDIKAANE